jgi:lysophospholipase-3
MKLFHKTNLDPIPITRYPTLFVAGDGGNQLYAKLNKKDSPHYFCKLKTTDYFELWLNLEEISPYVIDCFIDNMRLIYDQKTRTTKNVDGVDIRVNNFGQTDTLEYLDSSHIYGTSYYSYIVSALVTKLNYVKGKEIRGAPYDWRKAPNELDDYFKNLTSLLIETYTTNNNTKVILIAHSMGNPIILYWLNNYLTQQDKDTYIRAFVSLSPPWGGAAKPLRLMASGDNIDVAVVRPLAVRPYQRSAVSTAWLMPSDAFWSADEILVSQPKQNYTVKDYFKFFQDLNFTDGYDMRLDTQGLTYSLDAPKVEYHALYGVGVKTPESFVYTASQWPDSQPSVLYGDGDGTVNLRSLYGFKRWYDQQNERIFFKELKGIDHLAILKNQDTIDYILSLFYN